MDKFQLNNQVEKVLRGENTNFLNLVDFRFVINNVKKYRVDYKIFKLYEDCEKLIIYTNDLDITLFEIESKEALTHREILGSLFSHNISEGLYGDIIISDKYYIVVSNKIKDYIVNHYTIIGKKKIKLIERNFDEVKEYKNKYQDIKINVSSLRIDNIISKIIPTSRSNACLIIKDKKVILNYHVLSNHNYVLKDNDIFSIRGIGKFKYMGLIKINKNGKYSIFIKKYI